MSAVAHNHRPLATERTGPGGVLRRIAFHAMGTNCEIQYACDESGSATAFERTAHDWVQAFEAKYSRFRDDSLVSRINAAAGLEWIGVDADMEQMLKLCDTLYFLTEGI